ncbi:RHS repeat domain-containing protein [Pseudomonas sp. 10S4]|uniref:RHS repeat domain-containing protein n=1 Tax=Pseudomonas sp. 10S4 TaxID=3048583 RepID=UPI002B22C157|nr:MULTISPECIES: RHS repeat-associated core domain-containing protein [unclassified Pseudomonas]MEB0225936.1 RHS repeat-associated core domain-containing protein [Pseudomonas sp. 5S1]MEB0294843.1 RHS repeat-associated core domain-containing protein [Pseudomonas sp. 10S4]
MRAEPWIDTHTPTLSAMDPRGLAIRNIAYCRHPLNPSIEARISRNGFDARRLLVASWDPRLWGVAPTPNLATLYGLNGQPLMKDSVDAGWQLSLSNQAGSVLEFRDSRGSQRRTEYDALQRPITVTEQLANESPQVTERLDYGAVDEDRALRNQCGRLVRHDHPAGSRQVIQYGLNGEALSEQTHFLLSLESPDWPLEIMARKELLEETGFETNLRCGPTGEMLGQIDAMENQRLFAYTRAGELKSTQLKLAGADGSPELLVDEIHYDASGNVVGERMGNDVRTTASYAAEDGRLLQLMSRDARGQALQVLDYAYDPVGNVRSVQDHAQLTRHFNGQRIEPINRFRYDSLYQLIEATGREVSQPSHGPALPTWKTLPLDPNQLRNYTQRFDYDAAGNLIRRQHGGAETFEMFTSDNSNRSVADNEDLVDGFDANGNQQTLLRGQPMDWDVRNQLSRVAMVSRENGPDDSECYFYASAGQRARKTRLTHTARRTLLADVRYLPGVELHCNAATGEEWHVICVLAGRSQVCALHWVTRLPKGLQNNQLRYSLNDHLGSSTVELDKEGQLLSREGYYPYGGTAWWVGHGDSAGGYKTIRYSGKERDASGLYYFGWRYYAPWLQRWLSADPAGDVNGLNLFVFCGNNPVSYADRQGLMWGDISFSEAMLDLRYGVINYLHMLRGPDADEVNDLVTSGFRTALASLTTVTEMLKPSDTSDPDMNVVRHYAKNSFGPGFDSGALLERLGLLKEMMEFYVEHPSHIALVKRSDIQTVMGNARGQEKKLYAGVRIVPNDEFDRLVISEKELFSPDTLDIAFVHAMAIKDGAHEVVPFDRGYPMIGAGTLAYGDDLLSGRFDAELVSRAAKTLSSADLKKYFGTTDLREMELNLKLDSDVRTRFMMDDAGVITSFVTTVSRALQPPAPPSYPHALRARASASYRSPKAA